MEMERPKITCEETDNGSFARFVVEPLEKGYGITLGNAMRRTLLSSLPGSAPIAVRIAGVAHEFSTIRGVSEDVVDIILNLKTMAVKCENKNKDFVTYLHLRKTGAGEVTAKDFEPNSDVEILTPDLHICTMDDGAVLDMDVMIGNGRGYVSSNVNKTKFDNIDFIAIDSIFSPVKVVNFNVEATRVGQSVNYDAWCDSGGYIWVRQPRGNGTYGYIGHCTEQEMKQYDPRMTVLDRNYNNKIK